MKKSHHDEFQRRMRAECIQILRLTIYNDTKRLRSVSFTYHALLTVVRNTDLKVPSYALSLHLSPPADHYKRAVYHTAEYLHQSLHVSRVSA
jgi:hypothetical protein